MKKNTIFEYFLVRKIAVKFNINSQWLYFSWIDTKFYRHFFSPKNIQKWYFFFQFAFLFPQLSMLNKEGQVKNIECKYWWYLLPILSQKLNFKIGVDEPSFLLDDWLWGESFMDDIGTTDLPQWVQNLYEVESGFS